MVQRWHVVVGPGLRLFSDWGLSLRRRRFRRRRRPASQAAVGICFPRRLITELVVGHQLSVQPFEATSEIATIRRRICSGVPGRAGPPIAVI